MSDPHWWQMPGPDRFVQTVLSELRDGRNVLAWFPAYHPSGFLSALQRADDWSGMSRWTRAEVELDGQSPAWALHERFAPLTDNATVAGVESVLASRDFRHCLALAHSDKEGSARQWVDFLREYARASKTVGPFERGLLCVQLAGMDLADLPPSDVTLSVQRWTGWTGDLDMRLYVSRILQDSGDGTLLHAVRAEVVSALAGTDPGLARDLAGAPFETLFDPLEYLRTFSEGRGWSSKASQDDIRLGIVSFVGGREYVHSAALAARSESALVERRVWRGQVAQLFPFLEDRREELIRMATAFLPRAPFETGYERIDDVRQLEIGEVCYLLRQRRAPPRLQATARALRNARNALAHFRPLETSVVRSLVRLDDTL